MPMVKLVAEFNPRDHHDPASSKPFTYEILYPSTVVKDYFKQDDILRARDFISSAITAMKDANRRVAEKYGFGCFGCTHYETELERMLHRVELRDMVVHVRRVLG